MECLGTEPSFAKRFDLRRNCLAGFFKRDKFQLRIFPQRYLRTPLASASLHLELQVVSRFVFAQQAIDRCVRPYRAAVNREDAVATLQTSTVKRRTLGRF